MPLPGQNPLFQLISQIMPQLQAQQSNANSPQNPLAQLSGQNQAPQQGVLPSNPLPQTAMPAGGMDSSPSGNIAALASAQDAAGSSTNSILSSLSNYQTPMLDKYRDYVNNLPQPSDYQPSSTQRVLAGLAGMGGNRPAGMWGGVPVGFVNNPESQYSVTQAMLNQPYQKALTNYEAGGKMLEQGAGIEERDIANRRGIAETQARIDETTRENKARDADREVLRDRQQQDSDTRLAKAQDDAKKAADALAEKKTEYEETMQRLKDESAKKDANAQALLKFHEDTAAAMQRLHEAENASRDAQRKAENAIRDRAESDRVTEADRRNAAYEQRISDLSKPKPPPAPTTETDVVKGKPQSTFLGIPIPFTGTPDKTTTKTKGPTGNYQNPNPTPAAPVVQPQSAGGPPPLKDRIIGKTTWKMPNGNIGTWNGTGWATPSESQ